MLEKSPIFLFLPGFVGPSLWGMDVTDVRVELVGDWLLVPPEGLHVEFESGYREKILSTLAVEWSINNIQDLYPMFVEIRKLGCPLIGWLKTWLIDE